MVVREMKKRRRFRRREMNGRFANLGIGDSLGKVIQSLRAIAGQKDFVVTVIEEMEPPRWMKEPPPKSADTLGGQVLPDPVAPKARRWRKRYFWVSGVHGVSATAGEEVSCALQIAICVY